MEPIISQGQGTDITVKIAESLNSTIPVTPNVPFVPSVGLPGNPAIALLPVSFMTVRAKVPLTPFCGAKYATAPLLPTRQFDSSDGIPAGNAAINLGEMSVRLLLSLGLDATTVAAKLHVETK